MYGKSKRKDEKAFLFKCEKETHEKLKADAQAFSMSMSQYIEHLINGRIRYIDKAKKPVLVRKDFIN